MKIREATGKPGIVFPTANNYGGWMFSCLAWSYGVDFMEKGEDGKWKGFPGSMLLYFAALQSVSVEQYEAALIDGAGPWKRLWFVTRPAMEGLLLLNLVRQIISVFQIMEQPLAMTGGGPNGASVSLSYQLYQYGFNSGGKGTGQAMALGVIIFLILIVFTLFYFWLNKKVEDRL